VAQLQALIEAGLAGRAPLPVTEPRP